jgi:DNA-binding PadR family transcriptional regulator
MSRGPEWKNSASEPTLRLLAEHDLALSATGIYYNLEQKLQRPPSQSTITRALKGLREVGLVEQPHGSLYQITEEGRQYFAGDLNVNELEDDE